MTALREAMGSPALSPAVRKRFAQHADAARLGAIFVDLPYFHRFTNEVLRYVVGLPAKPSQWGQALHDGGAIDLLGALIDVARRDGTTRSPRSRQVWPRTARSIAACIR